MSGTYYEILGVDPNASPEAIRKAYKKRALQTHPDRLPQGSTAEDKALAEEQFRKVNNAYEVLIDPKNRKAYDLYGVWPPPDDVPGQTPYGASRQDPFSSFNDPFRTPFDAFFGSGNRRPPAFRDPFELFNSIFAEFERDFYDPFPRSSFHNTGFFNQGPLFPSLFSRPGFPSPFSSGFGNMIDFPEGSNARSYSYSSRGMYRNNGDGQGSQWVSESRMQRTVNGVTQTVIEKRDSEGNVHVRKIYPDGREQYTINGIEQSSSPPAVQGSSPAGALPAPPASNAVPPVHNSRSVQIPIRTHSHTRGKEREDVKPSRGDRHDNAGHSSSLFHRNDRDRAERERADRRSQRHSHRYDYEAAPPPEPAKEDGQPKRHWWGRS